MANKAKVIDKDLGFNEIMRQMTILKRKPYVKAGILPDKGKIPAINSPELTVAEVAIYNEFSTKKIPERSFVRSTYDEKNRSWTTKTKREKNKILTGKSTVKRSLGLLGQVLEKDIRKKIRTGPFAPNAPSTIAKKKSDRPLIDTSQMIQSVKSKVFL